jgi:Glycosyl transferases group 1
MRLLFATSLLPSAQAFSGYEIANRCILDGLRALGHDVVPVGFSNPGCSGDAVAGSIHLGELALVTQEADPVRKLGWLARAVRRATTFAAAKLQVIEPQDLRRLLELAGPFDGVVLNGVTLAAAFEAELTQLPFIYVAHNVEWKSAAENAAAATSFVEQTLYAREARLLKQIEARLTANAAFVHALAAEDIETFGLGEARSNVLPLTAHVEAPAPALRRIEHDACIIGTWSWTPNRLGLDWFLQNVVPLLPGDVSIAVAGRLPAGYDLRCPNVTAVGRVADASDFVRRARVLPLISRAGTGVQLKTLEAFELGLPTVATSLSVRGIGDLPANCIVTDDPAAFASAMLAVIRSKGVSDLDGRAFHAARAKALLAALQAGVDALSAAACRASGARAS